MAVALLVLTLACGIPGARAALDIRDNCDTADAAVWTGWIHGERRDTLSDPTGSVTHAYTTSIHIRLREVKEPERVHIVKSDRSAKYGIRYVGCRVKLKVEASEIATGYDGTCSNHTKSTYADVDKHESGLIGYQTSKEPVRVVSDEDIPPEGVYMLTFAPPGMWSPCKDRFPEVAYMLGNQPLGIGDTRFYGYKLTDQQIADNGGDPKLRLLSEKRTRMTGSYSYTTHQNTTSIKVMWDICREGNKNCAAMPGSSPPSLPPPMTTQAPPQSKGCGDGKQGMLYVDYVEKDMRSMFAGPSTGSPLLGELFSSTRIKFTETVVQNGSVTWYHVYPLYGRPDGWLRAAGVSCVRPAPLPAFRPLHLVEMDDAHHAATGAAAQVAGCRG